MVRIRVSEPMVRVAVREQAGGPSVPEGVAETAAARPANHLKLPVGNIKEIKESAFAKGRQSALDELEDVVLSAVRELRRAACDLRVVRDEEHGRVRDFAVRLGCTVAQELTRAVIDAGDHRPQQIVEEILRQLFPDGVVPQVEVRAHPNDIAVLQETLAKEAGGELRLVADPELPRASFRVEGGGLLFDAGACERLEVMQDRLLEEQGDARTS